MASFPDQYTYKVFTNPWLKSLTLERRGEEGDREERGARERKRAACSPGEEREREREKERGYLTPTTLNPKD